MPNPRWSNLKFAAYVDPIQAAVNVRRVVFSDPPVPQDRYWVIPMLDVVNTDSNGQILGMGIIPASFGMPPNFGSQTPAVTAAQLLAAGFLRVYPGSGLANNATMTNFDSQAGEFASPIFPTKIIVPSGYRVMAYERNGTISAIARRLHLRFFYLELDNECPIPEGL